MLTPFGKELRKQRIDKGMLLRDMAEALRVSVSWLSAVETGRKPIPEGLVDKVAAFFGFNEDAKAKLRRLADISKEEFKLRIKQGADDDTRDLAAALARRFDDLSDEEKKGIRDILNRRRR